MRQSPLGLHRLPILKSHVLDAQIQAHSLTHKKPIWLQQINEQIVSATEPKKTGVLHLNKR